MLDGNLISMASEATRNAILIATLGEVGPAALARSWEITMSPPPPYVVPYPPPHGAHAPT